MTPVVEQLKGVVSERDHYRSRAASHHTRADWNQHVAAMAMRVGLVACNELRRQLAHETAVREKVTAIYETECDRLRARLALAHETIANLEALLSFSNNAEARERA